MSTTERKTDGPDQALEAAFDVIGAEIGGLEALKAHLGGVGAAPFQAAVAELAGAAGRVIVTGMGKSGHIGRKLAATLASTGKPAQFVHPAEASHGDLGMIAPGDAVIALSKSGETPELGDVLGHAARFSIPVIAITAEPASALGRAATHILTLPPAAEACAETSAPTTSTTMMAALGDALSVALLRGAGFTAAEFHGFHPGGTLGAALRRVRDLMHGPDRLPLQPTGASLAEAIKTMTAAGFGCVGVTDDQGALIGVVTDGDLRRNFGDRDANARVDDVMSRTPKTVGADALAGEALALLSRNKITGLFVVSEDGRPIGLVHVHDCLQTGVI
ncbi:MAG: KpsF/GutQ family sugar-phosphate isomerase [Pseudomonadota bacterium]